MFEKREEMKMWESILQTKTYQRRMEDTLQELEIQAVTGAGGFGAGKAAKEKFWNASIQLTAWKEVQSDEIHQGEILLSTPADDRLLRHLQNTVKQDSVIQCRVRPSRNGRYLLLLGPVQAGDDPGLKVLLEEQIREVTMEVEGLGTFTLERLADWFEIKTDWQGEEICLSFDREEENAMERSIATARILMADQKDWDRRVRECAVKDLLDLANDWAAEEMDPEELERLDEEDEQPVSREQFLERLELESIQVEEDGGFEFWFRDGDMFYGHSIHVTGNLEDGPDWASIEG